MSLASFRPRPVASRTTLITLTLLGPTSVSSTSNSVFSSSAAPPAAPPAATTTPAAADTPNSSSQALTSSFSSNTDNSLIETLQLLTLPFCIPPVIICIPILLLVSFNKSMLLESGLARIRLCLCRAALGLCDLIDNAGEVGDGGLHAAEESAEQFVSGGNGCDHLSSLGIIVSSLNYGSL